MKRIFIPIAACTLALTFSNISYAQVTDETPATENTASAPQENPESLFQQSVLGYYDALAKKDRKKVLAYMHPKSLGINALTATIDTLFPVATFKYDISNLKLIGIDGEFAFVRYTQLTDLVASTVEIRGERSEMEMLDVYRKDGTRWKRWTTDILTSTPKPSGKSVKPTYKPSANLKTFIDPAAKTILERAAKLYGSTAKWRGQLAFHSDWSDGSANISFERPKKLRLEKKDMLFTLLIIADGKNESTIFKSDEGDEVNTTAQSQPVEITLSENGKADGNGEGIATTIALLLAGKTGLNGQEFLARTQNAMTINVKRYPDTQYKNLKCQRVTLDIHYKYGDLFSPAHYREELWFTPEGKLWRSVGYRETNGVKKGDLTKSDEWDNEITNQNFAPVFDAKTFVFTAPKPKARKK